MPKIAPLNLTSPEWEKQDGESNRQYFFEGLFIRSDETVEEFHSRMVVEYSSNGKKGFLNYAPYSLDYFRVLCTQHKWIERREAKKTYELDKLFNELDEIENNRKVERFKLKESIEFEALEKLDDKLTGGQFKDYTQGVRNLQDSRNIDREKPTDYSKQKVEAEVEAGVETNLKVENNKSLALAQKILLKPEFVEFESQLMDEVTNELHKQRKRDE